MASNLQFYFAWVQQTDVAFNPSFARNDENPFTIEVECSEGQIPKLTIEIINPRVGPIAPGRLYWAWLSSSENGGAAIPLFFGRLVGIPQSILYNTVKYEFISRAVDYILQKQRVAEALKTLPNYDPLFFDVLKRDDPDAILEGWSSLYAVDRVTGQVTASDILVGEDGTIAVPPAATYYDSVQMKLLQSPLKAVNVKAQVTWRQQYMGFFNIGTWSYPTLGSEPFVADWPKSGANLGGGYSGAIAWAGIVDLFGGLVTTGNASSSYNWQSLAKKHIDGEMISYSASSSRPTQPMTLFQTFYFEQAHQTFPGGPDGNPPPVNTPAIQRIEWVGMRTYALNYEGLTATAALGLRYEANRQRYERIDMTVVADVQPILIDPLITEDTETISLKSGDLGLPVTDFLNWSSVSGQSVSLGEIIFPDNPLSPGQTSSQICVVAGTAGAVEPTFSNVAGATTADGTAVWSSLGDTPPTDSIQDWQFFARVPLGTLLLPRPIANAPDLASLTALANLGFNSRGVPTAKYTVYATNQGGPGDTMLECIQAGVFDGPTEAQLANLLQLAQNPANGFTVQSEINTTQYKLALLTAISGPAGPGLVYNTPSNQSVTTQAIFESFINPSGQSLYIAVQAGITGEFHTTFNDHPGGLTHDGLSGTGVIWQCLGPVSLPIGGWPGMTPAAAYFPTDRGQQSLQHLICRARAKLRRRARAVQVSFQCDFEAVAPNISCRMNASITDARLPGGGATGKVIGYKLKRDGDSGMTFAEVTIGCSIGGGSSIETSGGGAPSYVANGYVAPGYQTMPGATVAVGGSGLGDIGYTPPVAQPVDDGLSFPLYGAGDAIITDQWHGFASTISPFNIDSYNAEITGALQDALGSGRTIEASWTSAGQSSGGFSVTQPTTNYGAIIASITARINQIAGQGTNLWYELALKNLVGGPYNQSYVIATTLLAIPMTIDLSAPSSG